MTLGAIALLAALGGLWIDVPFVKQSKNGCGPAAVWMVMQYWDRAAPPLEEIHQALYSDEAGGVFASDMERYLNQRGFRTLAFTGKWEDLVQNVSEGRPLIVVLEASPGGAPLHYVVVAGIHEDQQAVLLNDPARRKLWPLTRSEFEKSWDRMNRWTLLATPREPRPGVNLTLDPAAPAESSADAPSSPDLEAASQAFRNGDYTLASRLAHRVADAGGADPLVNDLLATTYLLQDNVEAALKYWNRINEPRIRDIHVEAETRWNPVLLDRTVAVSRASILQLDEYRLTQKRLEAAGAFSRFALDLKPAEGDNFDLGLRAADRGSMRPFPVSWLRGLPYQTLSPELVNLGGKTINVETMWRWDPQKQRALALFSAPAGITARYYVSIDVRDEDWEWNNQRFRLWRQEVHAGVRTVATSKLAWTSGAIVSRRSSGASLRYDGGLDYDLWTIPEKRFSVGVALQAQAGKLFAADRRFAAAQPGVTIRWFPQARGADYKTTLKLRAGRIFGDVPFDELFSIGLDRDHDLWLRAHPGTRDGRKGAGLIGRRYVLLNSEIAKTIMDRGVFSLQLVPFLDAARMGECFTDAGLELRVSIASMLTFSISAGHDLKSGRTAPFTNISRK